MLKILTNQRSELYRKLNKILTNPCMILNSGVLRSSYCDTRVFEKQIIHFGILKTFYFKIFSETTPQQWSDIFFRYWQWLTPIPSIVPTSKQMPKPFKRVSHDKPDPYKRKRTQIHEICPIKSKHISNQ